MATTFTATAVGVLGYALACCDAAVERQPRYGSYSDACAELVAQELREIADDAGRRPVLAGCELPDQCPEYPLSVRAVYAEPAPEVELHEGNAAMVLDALGYSLPDAFLGEAAPEEFEGRVLTALALAPVDAGVPACRTGGGRWVAGERAPGYLQARLRELQALARWCGARGRRVSWT